MRSVYMDIRNLFSVKPSERFIPYDNNIFLKIHFNWQTCAHREWRSTVCFAEVG